MYRSFRSGYISLSYFYVPTVLFIKDQQPLQLLHKTIHWRGFLFLNGSLCGPMPTRTKHHPSFVSLFLCERAEPLMTASISRRVLWLFPIVFSLAAALQLETTQRGSNLHKRISANIYIYISIYLYIYKEIEMYSHRPRLFHPNIKTSPLLTFPMERLKKWWTVTHIRSNRSNCLLSSSLCSFDGSSHPSTPYISPIRAVNHFSSFTFPPPIPSPTKIDDKRNGYRKPSASQIKCAISSDVIC